MDKNLGIGTWHDVFTVKSFYSSLVPCIGREFPSSLVWNPWVPKRVNDFAWETIWGRILTMNQPRSEISVNTDISVLEFYGYIGNIGGYFDKNIGET